MYMITSSKVKSCYNSLRIGTVIVLVSSGIDFVNTPRLYSDLLREIANLAIVVCTRGSPKCLDFRLPESNTIII